MARPLNLFYNLVNCENDMTELVCNLLSYPSFRRAFLGMFLDNALIKKVGYEDIDTQLTLPNGSRPDLVIHCPSALVLLEVKTRDQPLTGNQPWSYLEHARESEAKSRSVIFIVPQGYDHLVSIQDGIEAFLQEYPNCGVVTKIITWNQVIQVLQQEEAAVDHKPVQDFVELLRMRYEPRNVAFSAEEIDRMYSDTGIPSLIMTLRQLIDTVKQPLKERLPEQVKVLRSMRDNEYGLYILDEQGEDILWFGIWYVFWLKHATPLCFGVHKSWDTCQAFRTRHGQNAVPVEDYYVCPVHKSMLPTKDTVKAVDRIVTMLTQELCVLTGKTS